MKLKLKLKYIDINDIADSDNRFRISSCQDKTYDSLRMSLKEIGLVIPLLVCIRDGNTIPVCGFLRLKALRELGVKTASVLISDASDEDLLMKSIADNGVSRELNIIEQYRAALKLSAFIKDHGRLSEMLTRLAGSAFNRSYVKKLLSLKSLPGNIFSGLQDESISLAIAVEFLKWRASESSCMADIFMSLNLSLSKQKEIAAYSREISLRDDITVVDIFHKRELKDILEDKESDVNRKAGQLRKILKRMRYPEITKKETWFQNSLKESNLPSNIRVLPPRDFEGLTWSVNITFKSHDEYRETIKKLNGTVYDSSIRNLMDPS